MPASPSIRQTYAERASQRREVAEAQERRFHLIGNLRLAAGISALALAFFVFGSAAVSPFWFILPVGAFVALVVLHAKVVETRDCARRSLRFYEEGLTRLENRWMGKGETGECYRDPNHVYAEDLDVFGKGSLYELLCTARTRAGQDRLAEWLKSPSTAVEVQARQQAVAELAPRLDLREALALVGEDIRASLHDSSLIHWGTLPAVRFPPGLRVLAVLLSAGTLVTLIGYFTGFSGRIPLLIFVLVQMTLWLALRPRVRQVNEAVELPSQDLALLGGMLARIEREPVNSELLRNLQQRLATQGLPASAQIHKLQALAERLEWTHNQFFAPIAAILMWGIHLALSIEQWRIRSGSAIPTWIAVAGEFECLCALASYSYEHPADPFPALLTQGPTFDGEGLAHPLLPAEVGVPNSLQLSAAMPLLVVSGSNMSGKSTLLRTVGLNTVLAWAGAPVRAKRLSLSPLQIGASIRVQDSLQDGRSRFYAEITRLRQIVELTNGPRPVLFLVDELLSGTNSHDRRIGAAAIVKSLTDRGAIGLLTTHDLALADLAETVRPPGRNVHFEDQIEDGKLHFDYTLRSGVVERSNALELMRSVGLQV